jgi:predicted nucleic acid-binding protein
MYTLDANIFIRDLDPYDSEHKTCHTLLAHLVQGAIEIVIPLLVLAEVAGTVSRTRRDPIRARLAADAIRALPHISLIPLDESLAQDAANIAADYALRGADAVYVAIAYRYNCTLVSLDREQRERSAALIVARTPAEILANLTPPAIP